MKRKIGKFIKHTHTYMYTNINRLILKTCEQAINIMLLLFPQSWDIFHEIQSDDTSVVLEVGETHDSIWILSGL